MKRRIMVVMGLVLVLGVGASEGEWRMRIHMGATIEEHAVAEVDSVTFYETLVRTMVAVPAGVFTMGDGSAYCGIQQHEVTLTRAFYLGQREVTNQEYLEAVQWAYDHGYVTATTTSVLDNLDASTQELLDLDAEGSEIQFDGAGNFYLRESPSGSAQGAYPEGYAPADQPVKEVTWFGAARYCDWLSLQAGLPRAYEHTGDWACNGGDPYGAQGYRLPTDAEWEYAAQWDDERIYPWGNEAPDCIRANYNPNPSCVGWTSPVGSYPDAPAALGLSDMAGNVWEWCNDWWVCSLGTTPVTDPVGPASGGMRVLRGGTWSYRGDYMRCAHRVNIIYPDDSYDVVGFRVSGATVSQGEWRMRIHMGATVEEHAVAEIDSVTFYEILTPPPMVAVPAGVFTMGDGTAICGTQQHEVTLTRDFYLGQHEVTNQEYLEAVQWAYDHRYVTATTASVMDNLDGSSQELLDLDGFCEIAFSGGVFTLRDAGYGINADHPVMEVTWYGAARYCDWLSLQAGLSRAYEHSGDWACNGGDPYGAQGYRLPTDAEWEYAAQYDDERIYPWGNEAADCSRANYWPYPSPYCVGWTTAVGSYPDAPAALGLSDMAGNVSEWCNDWWDCSLGTTPVTDPPGPASGSTRVRRGGFWNYDVDDNLRCAGRDLSYPYGSDCNIGFRASRTITP